MPNLGVAIVKQYERGVVFRLGRLRNVRGPGLRFMVPLADRMWKVSLMLRRCSVPPLREKPVTPMVIWNIWKPVEIRLPVYLSALRATI